MPPCVLEKYQKKNITMLLLKTPPHLGRSQNILLLILHVLVIVGAIALVLLISFDTFRNVSFLGDPTYLRAQFWICMLFLFDIVVEFFLSPKKWNYIIAQIFFFLICIPYINLFDFMGWQITGEMRFVMRIVPMIRTAYVFALITGTLSRSRVTDMFTCYIILLLTIVYFSSMMFYVEEHTVNPALTSYWQALWWSVMNMTTAGCYIDEYTTVGRVLSVILSGGGLILFPVFTVYIAHAVAGTPTDE